MSGRPSALFPLFAGIETLPGIGVKTAKALEPLGIERPRDMLFALPYAVVDRRPVASVRELVAQAKASPASPPLRAAARRRRAPDFATSAQARSLARESAVSPPG